MPLDQDKGMLADGKKFGVTTSATLKKKLSANKKETTGTGGGPYRQKSFTALEEAVISLTNISSSVSGIGAKSFGSGIASEVPLAETSSNTAEVNEGSNENEDPTVQHTSTRQRKPMSTIQLLTKQI
ncbi:uncharacterized protein LOC129907626 isoform X1 [Episyrphus balteatus]|uniref:uncharacterized protein LOC129907626 isoform X1 n=1 Tax=Episyrphus balteatus TaxID=286459 RepID=UPI002486824B|nr:uncharacterized protein LOC129907626 isoform X1 [Episyrphus balteatus]